MEEAKKRDAKSNVDDDDDKAKTTTQYNKTWTELNWIWFNLIQFNSI